MTQRLRARFVRAQLAASERGAATAEYAVVSVAAAGLGGLLIKLLTSDWFLEIIKQILSTIITMFLNAIGLG